MSTRDDLFDLEALFGSPCDPEKPTVETAADLPLSWHQFWDERAALMEFDGGLPREQAEMQALAEVHNLMQAERGRS
jgi:hypothetical protein